MNPSICSLVLFTFGLQTLYLNIYVIFIWIVVCIIRLYKVFCNYKHFLQCFYAVWKMSGYHKVCYLKHRKRMFFGRSFSLTHHTSFYFSINIIYHDIQVVLIFTLMVDIMQELCPLNIEKSVKLLVFSL